MDEVMRNDLPEWLRAHGVASRDVNAAIKRRLGSAKSGRLTGSARSFFYPLDRLNEVITPFVRRLAEEKTPPPGYANRRQILLMFPQYTLSQVVNVLNRVQDRVMVRYVYGYRITEVNLLLGAGMGGVNRNGNLTREADPRVDLPMPGYEDQVRCESRWFPKVAFTGKSWSKADEREFNRRNPFNRAFVDNLAAALAGMRGDDNRRSAQTVERISVGLSVHGQTGLSGRCATGKNQGLIPPRYTHPRPGSSFFRSASPKAEGLLKGMR